MVFTIIYIFQSHGNNRNHVLIQSIYQHISSTYVFHVYHLSTSNEHPAGTSWGLIPPLPAPWLILLAPCETLHIWYHYDTTMIPSTVYHVYIYICIYIYTHLYLYLCLCLCLCLYTCIIRTCWKCFQIQISHGHGSFRVAGNDNPATVELGPQYLLSHHRRLGLKFASIWGFPARHGGTQ